ncbi:uncharacterized protein LOC105832506 [Monomorium pharaonis]|uniref:uncharacterized protein LOC105832506 n=1 Tax=Monomorium pharaonis TaxID=307658 RepID=UPI001746438D|nr:uncharacterized protein LOC105832506 [Monomorium pharaonis]
MLERRMIIILIRLLPMKQRWSRGKATVDVVSRDCEGRPGRFFGLGVRTQRPWHRILGYRDQVTPKNRLRLDVFPEGECGHGALSRSSQAPSHDLSADIRTESNTE